MFIIGKSIGTERELVAARGWWGGEKMGKIRLESDC